MEMKKLSAETWSYLLSSIDCSFVFHAVVGITFPHTFKIPCLDMVLILDLDPSGLITLLATVCEVCDCPSSWTDILKISF